MDLKIGERLDPRRRPLLTLIRWIEGQVLLILLAAAAALWAFLEIADEVSEGETEDLDHRLLLSLRNPADPNDPLGPGNLEEALRDVTALGGFTVLTLVTVAGALFFLFHRKRLHAAVLVGTVLTAQFASSFTKALYDRPRPDLVSHGSYVYSGSFPSGHSMLSAVTYLTLAMLIASLETRRATKILVYVLAMLLLIAVGLSRIYLGVHWPSDVLGGWTLGAAWSLVAWIMLLKLGGRTAPPTD
ncbi:phosphatase PAP2 family protein [Phenylobacterium sp. J367]|uniref:phosphatase PAP2 family protein n=1 Tax=Phenylobacterium sp. J367 TaxID=2898435 RepID=UPI00215101DD|nr:phosphatase PAP2 family protein [Phenylobacterium sp. J367]MCR5880873.1 phosphatase PAP2 family protein [Phenylobacterium sp. J367]